MFCYVNHSSYRFCEEDIDQILERRAHVIQLESEANSTFAKVSWGNEAKGEHHPLECQHIVVFTDIHIPSG